MAGPEVTALLKLRDDMSGPLHEAATKSAGSFGVVGSAALGVIGAAAAAGAALFAFGTAAVIKTTEAGQAAYQMGEKFGLSGQQASEWLTVARHLGVDSAGLTSGFKFLAKNVENLNLQFEATGKVGKGPSQVFKDLGISVLDAHGKMKTANELMLESADTFAKMPDGIEKTGLALKLFGKQGMEMLPVLNLGRDGLEKMMKAGQATGEVMSNEQVEAAHKMFLAQQKLNSELTGFTTIVGTALMPVAADFMAWLTGTAVPGIVKFARPFVDLLVPAVEEFGKHLHDVFGIVGEGFTIISDAVAGFKQFRDHLDATATAGDNVTGVMGSIVGAFGVAPETIEGVSEAFGKIVDTYESGLGPIMQDLGNLWNEVVIPAIGELASSLLGLEPQFQSMLEKVRPAVEVFMKLSDIAIQGLITVLKVVLPPAIHLLVGLFGLVMDVVGFAADTFVNLFTLLDDLFHGRWGKLWGDAVQLFLGMYKSFNKIMGDLVRMIGSFFGELIDNIVGKKGSIPSFIDAVVQWFKDLPKNILKVMVGFDKLLWNIGVQLVQGFWNGITQRWRSMLGDLLALARMLPDPIKNMLGIHSPSTVMAEVGRNYVAGLRQGIVASWPGMTRSVGGLSLPGLGSGASAMAFGGPGSRLGGGLTINIENLYGTDGPAVDRFTNEITERLGFAPGT